MNLHLRWASVALFIIASSISTISHAAAVSGQGTWESTLQARYFDNDATVDGWYDTDLDITWLANANAGAGSSFDDAGTYTGTSTDGRMSWSNANAWAATLNFNGINNWRLPTIIDADGPDADSLGNDGCDQTPSMYQGLDCGYNISVHSEMSHMFYVTLGNKAYVSTSGISPQPGWGLTNTANFTNIQAGSYRSATEYAPNTSLAWLFIFSNGFQGDNDKTYGLYAWAVHSGNVGATSPVPVPAAVWLFGSGLLGLIGLGRSRRHC